VIATAAADVSDEREVASALTSVAGSLGGLDALVVCAGIEGEMGLAVEEVTSEGFRGVLETNVLGAFHAVKAALPFLREAESPAIVLIGSDSGFVAVPGMLAYNASKGAIVQFTRALAVELYDTHGVRVNSVAPSIVDTPMARRGLGVAEFLQRDQDLHLGLARLGGNQLVEAILGGMRSAVASYVAAGAGAVPDWSRTAARLCAEHEGIVDAVARHDGVAAARLTREHIEGFYREAGLGGR